MTWVRRANQILVKSANVLFSNAAKDLVVSIHFVELNKVACFECNFPASESKR